MTRNFLETMGLEKEQINQILDENSQNIGKVKTELEEIIKDLKDQITRRDSKIEELETEAKTKEESYIKEMNQIKVNNAVDMALTKAKAKNLKAVKALLENLDKAELQEDGTVKGLAEQIESLRKSDEYLFEPMNVKTKLKGAEPRETGNDDPTQTVDTSKMTYSQLAAYMAANPEYKI